ncbi:hypothetical protein [Algivirga pacifica]|uniref:Uncharacterized protein n=1 Tax=Algivirga pacifica TaxID=1162670 RepID=A0ABP9D9D1_9BACT
MILVLANGGMAANCPGKIGDLVLLSAVLQQLQQYYPVTLGCNVEMKDRLQKASDFQVMELSENISFMLQEVALNAEYIFILKPFGDLEGTHWKSALQHIGIVEGRIQYIGNLQAYDFQAPHLSQQLWQAFSTVIALPTIMDFCPKIPVKKKERKGAFVGILPVAGGKDKELPISLLQRVVDKKESPIRIFGTLYGEDPQRLQGIRKAIQREQVSVEALEPEAIAAELFSAQKIYAVDGGLLWLVVAMLNFLFQENSAAYPEIHVIVGRKPDGSYNPVSNVWAPLVLNPSKLHIHNAEQVYALDQLQLI